MDHKSTVTMGPGSYVRHGLSVVVLMLLTGHLSVLPSVVEAPVLRSPGLRVDPGWEGFRNRLLSADRPAKRQDFGYSGR